MLIWQHGDVLKLFIQKSPQIKLPTESKTTFANSSGCALKVKRSWQDQEWLLASQNAPQIKLPTKSRTTFANYSGCALKLKRSWQGQGWLTPGSNRWRQPN